MHFSQLLMEGHTRLANDIRPIQPVFLFHGIRDMHSLTHDVKLYISLIHGNVLLSLHLYLQSRHVHGFRLQTLQNYISIPHISVSINHYGDTKRDHSPPLIPKQSRRESDDRVALGKPTSQIINQTAQIRPSAQAHESLKSRITITHSDLQV